MPTLNVLYQPLLYNYSIQYPIPLQHAIIQWGHTIFQKKAMSIRAPQVHLDVQE